MSSPFPSSVQRRRGIVAGAADGGAAERSTNLLISRQRADGAWEGEVVWCPLITAQVAILYAVLGRPLPEPRCRAMLHYFAGEQNPDGGWGLHRQSASYLFVTTMVYIGARLLGAPSDLPWLAAASAWIRRQPGGMAALPAWGKFWLARIGLHDPADCPPCPPELFLLRHWLPLAPARMYCHTRLIYLGMATLTGSGFRAELPIAAALRHELGAMPPGGRRHPVAASDLYVPIGPMLRLAYRLAGLWTPLWFRLKAAHRLRHRALRHCRKLILREQLNTECHGLSPVNSILNILALWQATPDAPVVQASLDALEQWRWTDQDGHRYAGARSSNWDTAFALQAILELPTRTREQDAGLRHGHRHLAAMQLVAELEEPASDRQPIAGGWCFGGRAHRWPVSDCTAEALTALLGCQAAGIIPEPDLIPLARLRSAAIFLLARQNRDGGFATYERRRGGSLLQRLNPSEMFGQCMTERSYVECTASALRALWRLRRLAPAALPPGHPAAIRRARRFLLGAQRPDGSWQAAWGIAFVYATLFALEALRETGSGPADPPIRAAIAWLLARQQPDGGWGEHFSGCLTGEYVGNPGSLVITTAWAVLALLRAEPHPSAATRRGLAWLAARQQPDGDWPRDSVNGVFFGTAMLEYRLYVSYFPAWALARAASQAATKATSCD